MILGTRLAAAHDSVPPEDGYTAAAPGCVAPQRPSPAAAGIRPASAGRLRRTIIAALFAAMFAAPAPLRAAEPDAEPDAEPRAELPTGVCMAEFCGPEQRRIWTRFERGEGLGRALVPGVYAGTCYVHDDLYDPDRAHHVGFVIDEVGGRPRLFLRFSFFAEANPFARLVDIDAARRSLDDAVLPVVLHDGHAYADYADAHFFSRYWFRRDPLTGHVVLVSYFGYRMTILCDAAANGV